MNILRKYKIQIAVVLPAMLFYLAWPPRGLFIFAFTGFIPFFFLDKWISGNMRFFLVSLLTLILFNTATTWWVWFASKGGSIAMILANSLLMTLPFLLYRLTRKNLGTGKALMSLVFYWIAIEYLHLNWEINWPWLDMGNVFAMQPWLVQWYEYTGMLGGSLWILLINVLLFLLLTSKKRRYAYSIIGTLLIPSAVSLVIYHSMELEETGSMQVALVQPNVDPYHKFDEGVELTNLEQMLDLVTERIDRGTALVIFPETAVVEYIDEDQVSGFKSYYLFRDFLSNFPETHIVTGVSTYNFYDEGEKVSPTARSTEDGFKYESYNTAWELNVHGIRNTYHKMKLVPGVEKMPYPSIFGFLEYFSIDMGGISGSLGSDKEPRIFDLDSKPAIAPLICYESVFPGFVNQFVRKGAEIIVVITNDGWWGNTDGYKQHMYYACLRAIENRKEVLRSANTGISCHINYKGEILERTKWWEESVLEVEAKTYAKSTFYTRYGDYIGRFASFLAVFFALSVMVKSSIKHD